jgi:hypothetical protein
LVLHFDSSLSDVSIIAIVYEAIGVAHVANLCVTHLGKMYFTLTCEMCDSRMVQRILDSLRITIVAYYLVFGSYVSFINDFYSIILLFSSTPISDI